MGDVDELRHAIRGYRCDRNAEDGMHQPLFHDEETPNNIIARHVLRLVKRTIGELPLPVPKLLLMCGSQTKTSAACNAFYAYGKGAVSIGPQAAARGPDAIAEMLDAAGYCAIGLVAFGDCAVALCDVINFRLRAPGNNPSSSALRRDKFVQQDVLRRAGLPYAAQIITSSVSTALEFASDREQVVVKPRDSSGGDGVWLCNTASEVRVAFEREMGKSHHECGTNLSLVVAEAITGEEWIVNTVSCNGTHKVSDIWRGPSKRLHGEGPMQFVYDVQFLAGACPRAVAVVEVVKDVLSVLHVYNGAAHTELVWTDRPYVYEVNARCAGGLPRIPYSPTQLDLLAMSWCDQRKFEELDCMPPAAVANSAAVVFLIAPFDGWLTAEALVKFCSLRTFIRFERGLENLRAPFAPQRVQLTSGLFTSPGAIVLQGEEEQVLEDAARVRELEVTAYECTSPPS